MSRFARDYFKRSIRPVRPALAQGGRCPSDDRRAVCSEARRTQSQLGRQTDRGSPWQNGIVEAFFGRLRAELLNHTEMADLPEARGEAALWQRIYNTIRGIQDASGILGIVV